MSEDVKIEKKILEIVEKSSPRTVEDLIEQAFIELKIPKNILLKQIIELQNIGQLTLTSPFETIPSSLKGYILSVHAAWFWGIIILSIATTISIYVIPEKAYPLSYLRLILGSIFVLFLPGYSLVKAFFPTREIDNIERIALSIGMSLALVPLAGLLLNYTTKGIELTPITLILLVLTFILSMTALIREHHGKAMRRNYTSKI